VQPDCGLLPRARIPGSQRGHRRLELTAESLSGCPFIHKLFALRHTDFAHDVDGNYVAATICEGEDTMSLEKHEPGQK